MTVQMTSQLKFAGSPARRPSDIEMSELRGEASAATCTFSHIDSEGQGARDGFVPATPTHSRASNASPERDAGSDHGGETPQKTRKAPWLAAMAAGLVTAIGAGVPLVVKATNDQKPMSKGLETGLSTVTGVGLFGVVYSAYRLSKGGIAKAAGKAKDAALSLPQKFRRKPATSAEA